MKKVIKERMEELLIKSENIAKNKDFNGIGFDYSRMEAAYLLEKRIALRKGKPEPKYDPFYTRRGAALSEMLLHEQRRRAEAEKAGIYPDAVELFEYTESPVLLLPG